MKKGIFTFHKNTWGKGYECMARDAAGTEVDVSIVKSEEKWELRVDGQEIITAGTVLALAHYLEDTGYQAWC